MTKTVEKKEKAAAPAPAAEKSSPAHSARREQKKSRWTLEACSKIARRFNTREDWAKGAPSCFKASVARGWDAKISAHMQVGKAKPAPKKGNAPSAPKVKRAS